MLLVIYLKSRLEPLKLLSRGIPTVTARSTQRTVTMTEMAWPIVTKSKRIEVTRCWTAPLTLPLAAEATAAANSSDANNHWTLGLYQQRCAQRDGGQGPVEGSRRSIGMHLGPACSVRRRGMCGRTPGNSKSHAI